MRKIRLGALVTGSIALGGLAIAQAQTPDSPPAAQTPAAAPAPAPPPDSPLRHWGTDFSFLFDGYVDANFNNPPSGFNGLRNFDVRSDMPHVNMGMITIDHAPAPIGFHLDVGFGETFDIIHAGNRGCGCFVSLRRCNARECDLFFAAGCHKFFPGRTHGRVYMD